MLVVHDTHRPFLAQGQPEFRRSTTLLALTRHFTASLFFLSFMGRSKQEKPPKKAGGTARQLRVKLKKIMKASLGTLLPASILMYGSTYLLSTVRVTQDKTAKMWWTMHGYHQYLYMRRCVRLVGWPSDVRFSSLAAHKKPTLDTLHSRWRRRLLRFELITPEEAFKNSRHPERVVPGVEYEEGTPHQGRDDIKKSRFDKKTGLPVSSRRKLRLKGATSKKIVDV